MRIRRIYKHLSIKVAGDMYAWLKSYAGRTRMSMSAVVRRALTELREMDEQRGGPA